MTDTWKPYKTYEVRELAGEPMVILETNYKSADGVKGPNGILTQSNGFIASETPFKSYILSLKALGHDTGFLETALQELVAENQKRGHQNYRVTEAPGYKAIAMLPRRTGVLLGDLESGNAHALLDPVTDRSLDVYDAARLAELITRLEENGLDTTLEKKVAQELTALNHDLSQKKQAPKANGPQ